MALQPRQPVTPQDAPPAPCPPQALTFFFSFWKTRGGCDSRVPGFRGRSGDEDLSMESEVTGRL